MAENKSSGIDAKSLILLIIVAITVSVVVTLLQTLILGKSNVAITGGIVGALCVGLWMNIKKKKADAEP
jgi:predicted membrane protein